MAEERQIPQQMIVAAAALTLSDGKTILLAGDPVTADQLGDDAAFQLDNRCVRPVGDDEFNAAQAAMRKRTGEPEPLDVRGIRNRPAGHQAEG